MEPLSTAAMPPTKPLGVAHEAAAGRDHRPRGLRRLRPTGLGLSFPALVFVAAFMAYPLGSLVFLSVHQYSPLRSEDTIFVGIDNFAWLAGSAIVRNSLWVTLVFTVASVTLELVVGLVLAVFLARLVTERAGRVSDLLSRLFTGIFILPFAAPAVVAAVAWKLLLHPQFGPIDAALGITTAWFSDYALLAVIVTDAWKTTPFVLFLLFAAIMSVEPTQFEAGAIDGANRWQQFLYLTLPSILPVLLVTAAFRAVDAFTKIFDTVVATTGGGPGYDTQVFPLLVWKVAFEQLNFGQAAALAVVGLAISLAFGGPLLMRRRAR
jgi:ABC-type sugar transport system permease subunit